MGKFICPNCGRDCCTCSGCQPVTLSSGKQGCSFCQVSAEVNINNQQQPVMNGNEQVHQFAPPLNHDGSSPIITTITYTPET